MSFLFVPKFKGIEACMQIFRFCMPKAQSFQHIRLCFLGLSDVTFEHDLHWDYQLIMTQCENDAANGLAKKDTEWRVTGAVILVDYQQLTFYWINTTELTKTLPFQ